MKKRSNQSLFIHGWLRLLLLGLSPMLVSLFALYLFILLDAFVVGIILFILIITLGLTAFFVHLFRQRKLTMPQFMINIVMIIIFTSVIFAVAYTLSPYDDHTMLVHGEARQLTFSEGMFFSIDTLTTLGYGIITPEGFFRIFAMIEVILGLFYLGLFIAGISHIYDR